MLLIHVFQTGGRIILSRFRYPQCRCQQTSWLLRIPLHSETGAGSLKKMVKMGQTKHFLHMSASLWWYKKRQWAHVWGCLSWVSKIRRSVLGHQGVEFPTLLIAGEHEQEEVAQCLLNKWCSWDTTFRNLQEGNHKMQWVLHLLLRA